MRAGQLADRVKLTFGAGRRAVVSGHRSQVVEDSDKVVTQLP